MTEETALGATRMNHFWILWRTMVARSVLGILIGALLLVGCDLGIPTADELVGNLDRLEFGPEWRLQSEEVVEASWSCEVTETCPRAVRVYRVEATEFLASVSILEEAGLKTRAPFQSCIDNPQEGCRALGWDEDVAIRILIASEHGSEIEVQVHASKTVGAPSD